MSDNTKFGTTIELDIVTEEFEARLKRILDMTNGLSDTMKKFQDNAGSLGDGASSS